MKPRAAPSLLAALAALVPARLVKRLDAAPRSADAWRWAEQHVTTDSGEVVTLAPVDGVITEVSQLACTCLLSPRCFHVLAVAAALDAADGDVTSSVPDDVPDAPARVDVDASQREIAERALEVLGDWLLVGASAAGAVLQGELLRVVHEARIASAARLAGAALRAVRNARALRAGQSDFDAQELLGDLRELGSTARLLATNAEVACDVLGRARRDYSNAGSLRLFGVGCEPIVARSGYAGVVSYVCDERGRLFTLNDVIPADPSRAQGAYDTAILMGDTSISHRELTRSGLFVQDAAVSDDLRLSAGKQVKAVRASTKSSLHGPEGARLFAQPLQAQLDRAFADTATPNSSLVFVEARVLGSAHGELMVAASDVPLRVVPAENHASLPFRENLALLSELGGRTLLLVARVSPERPRTLAAVTIEAGPEALALPESFGQRVNLGLDVLRRAYLIEPRRNLLEFEAHAALDPLSSLRRRLIALALHGVGSLPPEAITRIDAERALLRRAVMPGAADALGALSEACLLGHQRRSSARKHVAEAFLAVAVYEHAATRALRRATFLGE